MIKNNICILKNEMKKCINDITRILNYACYLEYKYLIFKWSICNDL